MTKKITLGLVALVAMVAGVVGLSAFEAHVINVTAKIENALQVRPDHLGFGTVFPQEHLEKPVQIALSESFSQERDADDVEYIIRQKPKCGLTNENGTELIGPTATGHVVVGDNPATPGVTEEYWIDCGPAPKGPTGEPLPGVWGVLPSLCEYISKEGEDENDGSTTSFHKPWRIVDGKVVWLDTKGRLAKSDEDIVDNWIIDLAVPCFGDHCAQDWDKFVTDINPSASSTQYIQPIENEHKIFGCDLWIEVTDVSRFSDTPEPGTLTVKKIINGDQTLDTFEDFSFTVDGGTPVIFDAVDGINDVLGVSAGDHTVAEVGVPPGIPGYTTSINCGDGPGDAVVNVPAGGSASCTITNTFSD